MCVCVYVCVCERERERGRERDTGWGMAGRGGISRGRAWVVRETPEDHTRRLELVTI